MNSSFDDMRSRFEAVEFAGNVLAPFFLQDPRTGEAHDAFQAMSELDVQQAAEAWPFADEGEARVALGMMVDGLSRGIDDDALMWEYRRLFVGPAVKPAPPWGSVYTDRECVVFGASTLELRSWMRAHGIERTVDDRTPEDHIGLMLSLMAYLASAQPDDVEEYLQKHLLTWAPHFLDELAQAAEHPFYEGLARLTKSTLFGIQQAFSIDVAYPRFYR